MAPPREACDARPATWSADAGDQLSAETS